MEIMHVAAQRLWTRLVDGDQVWGSLSVSPGHYGVTRYWLVVFPPGIDRTDRRLLRAWRAWPTWGAMLWLLSLCLFSTSTPPARFIIPTILWLGTGAWLFARVGGLRTQVRTRCVTRFSGHPDEDPHSAAQYVEIRTLVAILGSADTLRGQGQLSAIGHEAIWWQVYDRMGAGREVDQNQR
jgi:hypothetical protein